MNSRLMRVLIAFIGIIVGCTAGYFLKDLDSTIAVQRGAADALRDQSRALGAAIADVRSAQVAYVARGQGEGFWMSHLTDRLGQVESLSSEFAAALTAPAAQSAFGEASAALQNFRTLDERIREYVTNGSLLLAGDLIFSDALEATVTASAQLNTALSEELRVRTDRISSLRARQLQILAGAGAMMFLLMVGLAATGAAPQTVSEPQVTAPVIEPVRFEAPLPRAKPAITPKLISTAQLCSELARVNEGRQLPHLLERASRVLDASGMIVWVADPDGRELHPVMTHGYPPQVLMRIGCILREANNAAALAYRSAETRTVAGDSGTPGAVLAPLLTSDGCIGVLSVEVKGGSERDESSQALAAIFAAQLATLVSPPVAAGSRAAAQA